MLGLQVGQRLVARGGSEPPSRAAGDAADHQQAGQRDGGQRCAMVDGKGGLKEFLPSNDERVVDGVRVKADSSRIFVFYDEG